MAEENKTGGTAFEDMMLALFAILLVAQIFQNGPQMLSKHFGIGNNEYLTASAVLSSDTPLGTKVNVPGGATFYSEAGGAEDGKLGTFPSGSSLILNEGPETIDGKRWWKVEDLETGKSGWVPESALIIEGIGGLGPATKLGTKAKALLDTNLWEKPGGLIKSGFMKMGEMGEITKGPEKKNGSRWWFFDRKDSNDDGWVAEAVLMLASDNEEWGKGTSVRGVSTVDIFEQAGSGVIVGLLKNEEKAKILGGPVEIDGELWWLIETENGETGWVPESALEDAGIKSFFKGIIATVMIIGSIIVFILLGGIVYVTIRTNQIRAAEAKRIRDAVPKAMSPKRNERWEKINEHASSENPNDWRLAIIEADVLLDELVVRIGYQGATLGERLKQAVRGDFKSVDKAWEAHKVRNKIAHEGSDFILTQRETKRIIDLYASVFDEFKSI